MKRTTKMKTAGLALCVLGAACTQNGTSDDPPGGGSSGSQVESSSRLDGSSQGPSSSSVAQSGSGALSSSAQASSLVPASSSTGLSGSGVVSSSNAPASSQGSSSQGPSSSLTGASSSLALSSSVAGNSSASSAGSSSAGGISSSPSSSSGPTSGEPTLEERTLAATQTATTNPACSLTELPEGFYWEIGDRTGKLASGKVTGSNTPEPDQVIAIASASKWLYSTYALQKVGSLRESDVPYLNFTSGYIAPPGVEAMCGNGETVGECAVGVELRATAVDKFYYSAGHFQYHAATVLGLATMGPLALTAEIESQLGDSDVRYLQTNLAGGANASANTYSTFLRRMLNEEFVMGAHLGTHKVCASAACAEGLVLSPAPPDEGWNYSLGHWVEDDPLVGDHAFSSAGALGFYPWIDASKTWYGVFARRADSTGGSQGMVSSRCGRLMRQAWVTGVATTDPSPMP